MSERDDQINQIKGELTPGTTLYSVLRWSNGKGTSRDISTLLIKPIPEADLHNPYGNRLAIRQYDYAIQEILGCKMSRRGEGNTVGGGGMDMGFNTVYRLSSALYPNGFDCIGPDCPSNDHTNGMIRPKTPELAAEIHHNDGGYALQQRWL